MNRTDRTDRTRLDRLADVMADSRPIGDVLLLLFVVAAVLAEKAVTTGRVDLAAWTALPAVALVALVVAIADEVDQPADTDHS